MSAKKKNPPKISKKAKLESTEDRQHWFPKDAKAPSAETKPAKKSAWQRRSVPVNYGTLAKPGVNFKDVFNQHCDQKHKKLSEAQRRALWSVVANKMLSEPLERLIEIIDQESKNNLGPK